MAVWKEVRLDLASYLGQLLTGSLSLEERGRVALAWPVVWLGGECGEGAWRRAMCYDAESWAVVRERFADFLLGPDGRWMAPFMRAEEERQGRVIEEQRTRARKRWDAKAIPNDAVACHGNAVASRGNAVACPAVASALEPKSKPLRADALQGDPDRESDPPTGQKLASRTSRNLAAKSLIYTEGFEAFWDAYSCFRRKGKPAAFSTWRRLAGESISPQILAALEAFKQTDQWKGNFMPEPERWLRKAEWEDGPVTQKAGIEDWK